MPQPTKGPRLGGGPAHERLMLANLATSLFTHGRIHTTRAKAERLRPYAERLITKAKRGDLHNRRIIAEQIRDKDVVHRLIAEIGPFFADRPGGYTRIVKTLPRKGDNAPMAIIELVNQRTASAEASQATRVAASRGAGTQSSAPAAGSGDVSTTAAASAGVAAATAAVQDEDTSSPESTGSSAAPASSATLVTETESGDGVASSEPEPEGGSSVTLENDEPETPGTATDLVTEQEDKG